jgi:hypothetical protein
MSRQSRSGRAAPELRQKDKTAQPLKKQADFKEVEEENERTSKKTRNRQKKNEFVVNMGT